MAYPYVYTRLRECLLGVRGSPRKLSFTLKDEYSLPGTLFSIYSINLPAYSKNYKALEKNYTCESSSLLKCNFAHLRGAVF